MFFSVGGNSIRRMSRKSQVHCPPPTSSPSFPGVTLQKKKNKNR
jgi:hypothetical protein